MAEKRSNIDVEKVLQSLNIKEKLKRIDCPPKLTQILMKSKYFKAKGTVCFDDSDELDMKEIEGEFIYVEFKSKGSLLLQLTCEDSGYMDVNSLSKQEGTLPTSEISTTPASMDSPETILSMPGDDLPGLGDVLLTNMICLGTDIEIQKSQQAIFGSDFFPPSDVINECRQVQPIINEELLKSLDTTQNSSCTIHSPWQPTSVLDFNDSLIHVMSQLLSLSEGQSCTTRIIHLHNHIRDDSFPLCYLLEPQFFPLKKPLLVFPCSLQSLVSSSTQYINKLMHRVALASTAHFSSPHVIIPFIDFYNFKFCTCFGDEDLSRDAYSKIRLNVLTRCHETFRYSNEHPSITSLLLGETLSQEISQEIFSPVTANSEHLSWNEFSFLIYIKACSRRFHQPVISLPDFANVAALFAIPPGDICNLLKTFQTLQLIFSLPNCETIILDMYWFCSCLTKVADFSEIENLQFPCMFYQDIDHVMTLSTGSEVLGNYLTQVFEQHHFMATSNSDYFTPLLLPSDRQISFPCIDSIYLLPCIGIMPPGFFEKLMVLFWRSPQLSLIKCKCRSSAIYELCLDDTFEKHLRIYNLMISNKKGFIKVSLSNAYNSDVPYSTFSLVASIALKEIKTALKQILPNNVENSMTIFFECHDVRCQHSSEKKHLTRVHIKHLACTQHSHQKLQLNQLQESQSFWISHLYKDATHFDIREGFVFKGISRIPSSSSNDVDVHCHSSFLRRRSASVPLTMTEIEELKQESSSTYNDTSVLVERFLHQQSLNIYDNLDLICRGALYQVGILKYQTDLDIIAQGETNPESYRDKAIETITKAVTIAGVHGVIALVSAVKADIGHGDQDDHAVLYKLMIRDPNYNRIKSEWLHQLL